MPHLRRRSALRWGVPAAAVAVVAIVGSGVLTAGASPNLPDRSAAQLLADIRAVDVPGFSGQLVENASLGLPDFSGLTGGSTSTSFISLLSGSHTARVWYAGPDKQRFALMGTLGETDIFHNGTDLWQWQSDSLTATHTVLPAPTSGSRAPAVPSPTAPATLTPQQLADQALAAIDPSTVVTTEESRRIAGRSAYDLVLSPRDSTSRVGSIRIGIDAQYKLPLSFQVFPRGDADHAAFDVSFSSVDFSVPSDSQFVFTPPKTAKVKQESPAQLFGDAGVPTGPAPGPVAGSGGPQIYGSGWTAVVKLPGAAATAVGSKALVSALSPVSGTWGTGRLFTSTLVTALFVDGGPVYAGAVDPSVLFEVAGRK